MIAADTSSLVAYINGENSRDTQIIDNAVEGEALILPPIVVAELTSVVYLDHNLLNKILSLPVIEIKKGYWERAGRNRGLILSKKFKARLADTLIAQSCIDHDTPLITRDSDYRHFAKYCGLRLL